MTTTQTKANGPQTEKTNREGMTFAEWLAAANAFRKEKLTKRDGYSPWRKGIDPTEFADRTG